MSGGHFEYGQLLLVANDAEREYQEIAKRIDTSMDPAPDVMLAEALFQLKNGANKLYELAQAADYFISGDHGPDKLRGALTRFFGYDRFHGALEGPRLQDQVDWVKSLAPMTNKEEQT